VNHGIIEEVGDEENVKFEHDEEEIVFEEDEENTPLEFEADFPPDDDEQNEEEEQNLEEQRSANGDNDAGNQEIGEQHTDEAVVAPRYGLRSNRDRTYDHRFENQMDNPGSSKSYDAQFLQQGANETLRQAVEELQDGGSRTKASRYITGFIMTQMTAKAGIKKHGRVAIDALYQEFLQLHDLGVFEAQHANKLTKDQRQGALQAMWEN
jgi:hypothetical protein